MEQYISKSALVAEIERRKKYYENIQMIKPVYDSNIEDFNELLSFLNTIEVKEVVDLEKELSMYLEVVKATDEDIDFVDFAKHFFELGVNTSNTLTWEDIKLIWTIGDEIPYMPEEDFFKELLKRFKALKGE
jgi:hypothetical protein